MDNLFGNHLRRLIAPIEPLATFATGTTGAALGGLAGLGVLGAGGSGDQARRAVEGIQRGMTYQPRTSGGQELLEQIGRGMEQGAEAITSRVPLLSSEYRGDKALKRTGNPLMATLANMFGPIDLFPQAAATKATFLGAKAAQNLLKQGIPAPAEALEMARHMDKAGRSDQEIWEATGNYFRNKDPKSPYMGVFKGDDGQWRFELADEGAEFYLNKDIPATLQTPSPEDVRWAENTLALGGNLVSKHLTPEQAVARANKILENFENTPSSLQGFMFHDELFKAYPGMENTPFRLTPTSLSIGSFNPDTNEIKVNLVRSGHPRTPKKAEEVTLHEIQHAIQKQEEFGGRGANIDMYAFDFDQVDEMQKMLDELTVRETAGRVSDLGLSTELAGVLQYPPTWQDKFKRYQANPGEAEARLAETRYKLYKDLGRRRLPEKDMDVDKYRRRMSKTAAERLAAWRKRFEEVRKKDPSTESSRAYAPPKRRRTLTLPKPKP